MLTKQPKGATEKRKKSSGLLSLFWMFVGAILAVMVGVFAYLSPFFDFAKQSTPTTAIDYQVKPKVNMDTNSTDYEFYDVLPNQQMITIPDASVIEEHNNNQSDGSEMSFKPDVVVEQQRRLEEAAKKQLQEQQDAINQNANNEANQDGGYGISEQTILNPEDNNSAETTNLPHIDGNSMDNDNNQSDIINDGKSSASIQRNQPATTYILQINSFGNADEADRRRAQVLMAGVDAKVVKNVTGNGQEIFQVISVTMSNRNAVALAQQRLQNNGIDSIIVEQRRK